VDASRSRGAAETSGVAEIEALRTALVAAQRMILEVEEDGRRARAEVERLRQATADPGPPTPASGPATVDAAHDERLLVVLDADPTWEDASRREHRVALLRPGSEVPARLASLGPGRVLVNLAAPGALAALGAARAAGSTQSAFGCLAAPGSLGVLPLGRIEPGSRPLDATAAAAQLAGWPRGTRVLAVGTDAASLIRLRQTLTHAGLSVSIAWDGKQATGLLDMVRPAVVVVDLAVPPHGGYALVADLAAIEPTPAVLLVPPADDPAAAFATTLERYVRSARLVDRTRLVREVSTRPLAPSR